MEEPMMASSHVAASAAHPLSVAGTSGTALVVAILMVGVLSSLGLGLLLMLSIEPRAGANQRAAAASVYAADAALELAAADVTRMSDWNAVLSGLARSSRVDGEPSGVRSLMNGDMVDLSALTNRLICGRATGCTEGLRAISTAERPWGANNPAWRPFLFGTPTSLGLLVVDADYLIVWAGDDAMETDGDPQIDGGGVEGEGRWMLRLRALAIGPRGARATIDAVIARRCADALNTDEPDTEAPGTEAPDTEVPGTEEAPDATCDDAGSRLQSWRLLHVPVP
jgi:hypothetical protein